jgi:hypothetical protein
VKQKSANAVRTLVLYAQSSGGSTLSYNDDWLQAFLHHEAFDVTALSLSSADKWKALVLAPFAELIVFLHSTNSNEFYFPKWFRRILQARRGKAVFFVGNEYKLLPAKIALCRELRIDVIASQLPQDVANWLYTECKEAKIVSVPHAMNPERFRIERPFRERTIDFGVRAVEYPWYLGDDERARVIRFFENDPRISAYRRDISFDVDKRLDAAQWAEFLNRCHGTVSSEAGASILERDDDLRNKVNAYTDAHPTATFAEVDALFFKPYKNPVSGKAVAARHFDAIGAGTCQILLEGKYNGILKPDEHYIPLAKDYSNIDEALAKFDDAPLREKIALRAREFAVDQQTYAHRLWDVRRSID